MFSVCCVPVGHIIYLILGQGCRTRDILHFWRPYLNTVVPKNKSAPKSKVPQNQKCPKIKSSPKSKFPKIKIAPKSKVPQNQKCPKSKNSPKSKVHKNQVSQNQKCPKYMYNIFWALQQGIKNCCCSKKLATQGAINFYVPPRFGAPGNKS